MKRLTKMFEKVLDCVSDGVYAVDTERQIMYWNRAAERITGFTAAEVMGRGCFDNILVHIDDQGRSLCRGMCPLAQTLKDGQGREDVVHLHHKAGHRVPVHVAVNALKDEQGKIIGAVETFRECSDVIAMRSTIERLKLRGCIDIETGLASRRVVELRLAERVQELQRFGWPCGVLLVEVDLIPELQASFGQQGVAQAMRMASLCVQNSLRALDTVGRWDETSFLAVVANTTNGELTTIAERVRMMVDTAYRQTDEGLLHVTVSVGAVAADPADTPQSLLQKAARGVYESRSRGRNRITVYGLAGDGSSTGS